MASSIASDSHTSVVVFFFFFFFFFLFVIVDQVPATLHRPSCLPFLRRRDPFRTSRPTAPGRWTPGESSRRRRSLSTRRVGRGAPESDQSPCRRSRRRRDSLPKP